MVKSIDKHISRLLDSLDTIAFYTKDHDCSSFTQDPKTVDACLMQLIVIGENIKNLRSLYPEMSKKLPSNQIL